MPWNSALTVTKVRSAPSRSSFIRTVMSPCCSESKSRKVGTCAVSPIGPLQLVLHGPFRDQFRFRPVLVHRYDLKIAQAVGREIIGNRGIDLRERPMNIG